MSDDETTRNIKVAAQMFLAGGFVLSALAIYRDSKGSSLNGYGRGTFKSLGYSNTSGGNTGNRVLNLPNVKLPTTIEQGQKLGRPKLKQYDVSDIDTRAGLIGELIRKGSLNPDLREKTVEILSMKCDSMGRVDPNGGRYCVKEKGCLEEVQAIFDAIRNPKSKYSVRYTRDALLADVFTAPERTLLKSHGGDCDDYVITMGSMLMGVGHPVRMRIVATRQPGVDDSKAPWSHIYLLTPTTWDNPNAEWISVDGSMDKPLRWEAPGAREVAKTGKAAGIIARVRDYTLMKPSEQG